MKKVVYLLTLVLIFMYGCSTEDMSSLDSNPKKASSDNATYGYFSFAQAVASNGHTMYIQTDNAATFPNPGSNTLSVHPKSVQGTGIFFHDDENGNPVASGTWTATELLSFKNYGPALGFPIPDGRAGFANIRVHLVANGSEAEFDAILRIRCLLPGNDTTPPSWVEGIRISVQKGLNFNKSVPGFGTLFIDLN